MRDEASASNDPTPNLPASGGPNRLPPGQVWTRKFPVVGEREPAPEALDLARWRLVVSGLVAQPQAWSWEEFTRFPRKERIVDIHCVTGWSRAATRIEGVPLSVLLEAAGILSEARYVHFVSASPRRHDTTLPLELALEDTWCVDRMDGQPLSVEHGFPLRTLTPRRYFYKSLKWLERIELVKEPVLGYWERESAYHPEGDPWTGNQRFTTGSIDPQALNRFRQAENLAPWRRRVLIGLDLSGWEPRTKDLRGLQLKGCNLRRARLQGADLRDANLSLCDLREADLSRANLAGADLEGADLAGANLSDANLSGAKLTAVRLGGRDGSPTAFLEGACLSGVLGALEDVEAILRTHPGPREPGSAGTQDP